MRLVHPGRRSAASLLSGLSASSPPVSLPAAIVMLAVSLALSVNSALAQDPPRPEDGPMPQRALNGGSYRSHGQINRDNVAHLQMVWSLGLGSGFHQRTPQVYDGIMFLASSRGFIQAIDAATGNLHWSDQVNLDTSDIHLHIDSDSDSDYVRVFDANTGDLVRVLNANTGDLVEEASSDTWVVDTTGDLVEEASSDTWVVDTTIDSSWDYDLLATGSLAMTGGLVFGGDREGWFHAFDHETGEEMWKINLGTRQSAHFPITYTVDERQYVAVNTNVSSHPDDPPGSTLFAFIVPDFALHCPLSESHSLSRSYVLYRDSPQPYWYFPFISAGGVEQIGMVDPGPVTICEAVHRSTWSKRFLWLRIFSNSDRGWIKVEEYDDLETFLEY